MKVLGLSFGFHDSAVAVIENGKVLVAAQEERFSRIKNDNSFPVKAIEFCMNTAEIKGSDIDHIAYYEINALKFDRIIKNSIKHSGHNRGYLWQTIKKWVIEDKFDPVAKIRSFPGFRDAKVTCVGHHLSHASSAFYCSLFDDATVITVDGVGENETVTISLGSKNGLEKLVSVELPNSIGLFYSALTAYLGFRVNEDEYKVMGMAAYGEPVYKKKLIDLFDLKVDGSFLLNQDYFNFYCPKELPYTNQLLVDFGPSRVPESKFILDVKDPAFKQSKYYADIAASTQACTEIVLEHVVKSAIALTGINKVCIAGGVALNCLATGKIRKKLKCDLYVQPNAGDAGTSIGAALYTYNKFDDSPKREALYSPYLGQSFSSKDIKGMLRNSGVNNYVAYDSEDEMIKEAALLISQSQIVGWLQGKFEWGPRALGNRSILANPVDPEIQAIVNAKIKFRELFRPFAPAVLEEVAEDYFDIIEPCNEVDPQYYMMSVCLVKESQRKLLPSITHIDGTARIQLVNRKINPRFYSLIEALGNITGVPVILNTSFNLRGEPIVNTPVEALKTFEWSEMDHVIMETIILSKSTYKNQKSLF